MADQGLMENRGHKSHVFSDICWIPMDGSPKDVSVWMERIGLGFCRNHFLMANIGGRELRKLDKEGILAMGLEEDVAIAISERLAILRDDPTVKDEHGACWLMGTEWIKLPFWGKEQIGDVLHHTNHLALFWVYPMTTKKNWKNKEENLHQQHAIGPSCLVANDTSNPFPRIYISPQKMHESKFVRATVVDQNFREIPSSLLVTGNLVEVTSWSYVLANFVDLQFTQPSNGHQWHLKFELCDENGGALPGCHAVYSRAMDILPNSKEKCQIHKNRIEKITTDRGGVRSPNTVALMGSFLSPPAQIFFGSVEIPPESITYVDKTFILVDSVILPHPGEYEVTIKSFHLTSNSLKFLCNDVDSTVMSIPKELRIERTGLHPLHWACIREDLALVEALLSQGARINERSFEGSTPLHFAVWTNNLSLISLLLKGGADPNVCTFMGIPPLHWSVCAGLMESTELLLSNHANVSLQNSYGCVALDYVTEPLSTSNPEMEQLLRKNGAHRSRVGRYPLERIPSSQDLLLTKLPSFSDVLPPKRQELFLRKIRQCCLMFNFNNTEDLEYKYIKLQTLTDLNEYVYTSGVITEAVYPGVFKMVTENMFRTLPIRVIPTGVVFDPEEDEPLEEPAWVHLQLVYDFFLKFIDSSEFNVDLARNYVNESFITRLLALFESEDNREREYLKLILHRIYGKFVSHRGFIRSALANTFCTFIYETQQHSGIAELLALLASIINGFTVPLKAQHKDFAHKVLLPLYKGSSFSTYHQQLSCCTMLLIERDPTLTPMVAEAILRAWPHTNSQKEILFITEIQDLIHLAPPECIPLAVWRQLATCISSTHFLIAEKALGVFNNEETMLIVAEFLPDLLPIFCGPLYYNSKYHWHKSILGLSYNVLRLFVDLDLQSFNKCMKEYIWKRRKDKVIRDSIDRAWASLQSRVMSEDSMDVGDIKFPTYTKHAKEEEEAEEIEPEYDDGEENFLPDPPPDTPSPMVIRVRTRSRLPIPTSPTAVSGDLELLLQTGAMDLGSSPPTTPTTTFEPSQPNYTD